MKRKRDIQAEIEGNVRKYLPERMRYRAIRAIRALLGERSDAAAQEYFDRTTRGPHAGTYYSDVERAIRRAVTRGR